MTSDRTIHARLASGDLIVRHDRAGKWYRESEGQRYPITLRAAVDLATQLNSIAYLGQPGGGRFDAAVRRRQS